MFQSVTQFEVFSSAPDSFVETIDADDVVFPSGSIVTVPPVFRRDEIQQLVEWPAGDQTEFFRVCRIAVGLQLHDIEGFVGKDFFFTDLQAAAHGQFAVPSGKEMMRSCRMYVCFDEIESGNAVVFRKNEIVATGMHDRLVQHAAFLATVSFMPEVDDVHAGNLPVILDHFTGPVIGTIVGDDELETLAVPVFMVPKDFLSHFCGLRGREGGWGKSWFLLVFLSRKAGIYRYGFFIWTGGCRHVGNS